MLNRTLIEEEIKNGNIYVDGCELESNKLENGLMLTLGKFIKVSVTESKNIKDQDEFIEIEIPDEGYVLDPSKFYLGRTNEYTKTKNLVPLISGLIENATTGLQVHVTAGFGDNGFEGTWTLEIKCDEPVRVYPNQNIGFILYHPLKGKADILYNGKYQKQIEATESRFEKEYTSDSIVEAKHILHNHLSKNNISEDKSFDQEIGGGMLSNIEIRKQIEKGNIVIENIKDNSLNKPNSCDIYLSDTLYVFDDSIVEVDSLKSNIYYNEVMTDDLKYLRRINLTNNGVLLKPGVTYLSRSREVISTNGFVPVLYGKTSNSLLGLSIDCNSGFYQSGYNNPLLFTIKCTKPTVVYPDMLVGNLTFFRNVNQHTINHGMLSGSEILNQMEMGNIVITPQDNIVINPNSVNLTLNNEIRIITDTVIDLKKKPNIDILNIDKNKGILLKPSEIYIARTNEFTETHGFVPCIDGRSSVGRKGINVHCSAGMGSIGYKGYWHLGLKPIEPISVEDFMKICQIYYYSVDGVIENSYAGIYQNLSDKELNEVYTRQRIK